MYNVSIRETMRPNMKKILGTVAAILVANAANADPMATITYVEPIYETVSVPRTHQVCSIVQVPVYGNVQGGDAGAGALGGMIIGGLLGKGVTGDDGGAAAGAVIGGIIGANQAQNGSRRVITGYRDERQCSNETTYVTETQISKYRVGFEWKGFFNETYTYNNYRVGDRIPITVTIVAQ